MGVVSIQLISRHDHLIKKAKYEAQWSALICIWSFKDDFVVPCGFNHSVLLVFLHFKFPCA